MAAKGTYRLSPLAEVDLEDIWSYSVETWSWEQAQLYHREMLAALERLFNRT